MSEQKHTPTPWRSGPQHPKLHRLIAGVNGKQVAVFKNEISDADFDIIVRAVNAHEQLVAALQNICSLTPDDSATEWNAALHQSANALAAAGVA